MDLYFLSTFPISHLFFRVLFLSQIKLLSYFLLFLFRLSLFFSSFKPRGRTHLPSPIVIVEGMTIISVFFSVPISWKVWSSRRRNAEWLFSYNLEASWNFFEASNSPCAFVFLAFFSCTVSVFLQYLHDQTDFLSLFCFQ